MMRPHLGIFRSGGGCCAAALQQTGAERDDHVVIFLPHGIEECWSIFGISMNSCIFVPVNSRLKAQQICYIVMNCGAQLSSSSAERQDEMDAALETPA